MRLIDLNQNQRLKRVQQTIIFQISRRDLNDYILITNNKYKMAGVLKTVGDYFELDKY